MQKNKFKLPPDLARHQHSIIARFFEHGLTVPEVIAISGHRDPRMLMRYTHLKAENIAEKLQDMKVPAASKEGLI